MRAVTGLIAHRLLWQEARALLSRLDRVKSFALHETMVPAAALTLSAQNAIEGYLGRKRREMRKLCLGYMRWLTSAQGRQVTPAIAQRHFTLLRLSFNAVLTQIDIFSDVVTQRSEHETGVWLSGLDAVAADALALPGYYDAPPLACYLDRGHGAAIRRAQTRLPGGGENPIAVIRVPRERMIGSGIASSLVHEVGHQAAALLDLVASLRPTLDGLAKTDPVNTVAWGLWNRWISEIVADFWSVARVGIASTLGLMGVVSLPRPFVFRVDLEDPHPIPWIRVKLSCAMGNALYPHPQWRQLADIWESYYPKSGLRPDQRTLIDMMEASIPAFVTVLVEHRPRALRGNNLREVLGVSQRQPEQLARLLDEWRAQPDALRRASPALVFAVIGQARADSRMSPEEESRLLGDLLRFWALRSTLDASELCGLRLQSKTHVPAA